MRRALELARHGIGNTSPNPMVGAVIVSPDGVIIGEGYHRRCGEAHAEVNAVDSVSDKALLRDSTMYVTLEPCSHYGKTPPCAEMIVRCGIPRVVIATVDPNEKVAGRGIEILRQAGVEVEVGLLGEESRRLNSRFITAFSNHRPFVTLKWAQSADGYMDITRNPGEHAAMISTPLSRLAVHRLRALHDAIMVGSGTVLADDPLLDTRLWGGRSPLPVVMDRRGRVGHEYRIMGRNPIIVREEASIPDMLRKLYDQGITSLLVEGGAMLLSSFIEGGDWDVARIETGRHKFGEKGSVKAPDIDMPPLTTFTIDNNLIEIYARNPLVEVKNL